MIIFKGEHLNYKCTKEKYQTPFMECHHKVGLTMSSLLIGFSSYLSRIKTSGSESRGQEEAACMHVLGLCDHYSELFTWMEALNF